MGSCSSTKKQANPKNSSQHLPLTQNIRQFYRFGDVLGQGAFGTVKIGYRQSSQEEQIFAIKTINKAKVADKLYLIRQEFDVFRRMDHPNIVRFHQMYEDELFIYFVMEHCEGGDLLKKILADGPVTERRMKWIMRKLFSAVAYMHNLGVMHRDLKPENILFLTSDENCEIKIIDFGLSKKLKQNASGTRKHSKVGTPLYVAPEVIRGNYTLSCDEWALGCIMYILITGEPPFYSDSLNGLLHQIQNEEVKFHQIQWSHTSYETKEIINGLLMKDPEKRMKAAEVLKSPWAQTKRPNLTIQLGRREKQNSTLEGTPVNTSNIRALREYANYKKLKKEILRILIKQLSQKELERLTEKFQEVDKNHDGYITYGDLTMIVERLGYKATQQEIQELMRNISSTEGTPLRIKYTQFLSATIDSKLYLNKERMWSLFRYFDSENKNYITDQDIRVVLEREGRFEVDFRMMMDELKRKQEGRLDFQEFCQLMHGEMDKKAFMDYFEKQYASPLNNL